MKMMIPALLRETPAFAPAQLDRQHAAREAGQAPMTAAGGQFRVELATDRLHEAAFCARWRELVGESDSAQRIYQTPEFFRYLLNTGAAGSRAELLAIVRQSDDVIEGVVPVVLVEQPLNFAIGQRVLFAPKVPMVRLLGSIPAVSPHVAVIDTLARKILAVFPEAHAIFMQALPQESHFWRALARPGARRRGLATALLGDWRDCHTMPLPATFEQYLEKFSAKKRYNLNRQIRRLDEQVGTLELMRIEQTGQVGVMLASLAELVSPAQFADSVNPRMLAHLAAQGLLCCYVLRAGSETLAVIIATRSATVMHIDKIFVTDHHRALSVGTSAMHLAVKDIIAQDGIGLIDFGYGTPKHEFASSHLLQRRGQVLLFDSMASARVLFYAHAVFFHAVETLIPVAKRVMAKLASWMGR